MNEKNALLPTSGFARWRVQARIKNLCIFARFVSRGKFGEPRHLAKPRGR